MPTTQRARRFLAQHDSYDVDAEDGASATVTERDVAKLIDATERRVRREMRAELSALPSRAGMLWKYQVMATLTRAAGSPPRSRR